MYLDVAHVISCEGRVCDHLVVMRRMPRVRCLSRLVAEDDPRDPRYIDQIADTMAAFHGRPARSAAIDQAGTVAA